MAKTDYGDLTEQASIYGSYHNNVWNQIIHMIFVPTILLAFSLWLAFPLPFPLPFDLSPYFPTVTPQAFVPNLGLVIWLAMCLYFSTLDVLLIMFTLLFTFSIISNAALLQYGALNVFWLGTFLQIIGWGFQVVVGHGYFEGRKPAISDSLFQAIVSPFFLVLEVLFLFGYRKTLNAEIQKRVAAKIADWKASKAKKN